jgi:hypothetical protein
MLQAIYLILPSRYCGDTPLGSDVMDSVQRTVRPRGACHTTATMQLPGICNVMNNDISCCCSIVPGAPLCGRLTGQLCIWMSSTLAAFVSCDVSRFLHVCSLEFIAPTSYVTTRITASINHHQVPILR